MKNPHLFFCIPDWEIHKYSRLMNPVIFWIHQSVTKIRLPDSKIRKSTSCFRNKVKASFEIYKIVRVQEEKCRGAGRRSPIIITCTCHYFSHCCHCVFFFFFSTAPPFSTTIFERKKNKRERERKAWGCLFRKAYSGKY